MSKQLTEDQRLNRNKRMRDWRKNNKDKQKAIWDRYLANNGGSFKTAQDAWKKQHPNYAKEYHKKNRADILQSMKQRYHNKKKNEPWRLLCEATAARARKRKIPFNLDVQYVESIWADKCPVFGISMGVGKGKPHDISPSIDRIVPALGYVKGNVKIISYKANVIKNSGSAAEHRQIAEYIDYCIALTPTKHVPVVDRDGKC